VGCRLTASDIDEADAITNPETPNTADNEAEADSEMTDKGGFMAVQLVARRSGLRRERAED
jgi:hypothetical protein